MRILILLFIVAVSASGCSVPGGWKGAVAEKDYDQQLELRRTVELYNNDDYYEVHKDGRIYAFSDFEPYQSWMKTGEVPLVVTHVGTGPGGETLKLQLNRMEAKSMERVVGYRGAAQRMFENELTGTDRGFYAEVLRPERVWVFESGKDLHEFKKSGEAPCGITAIGAGPDQRTVVFVQNCKTAAKSKPDAAMARFRKNYGLN